MTEIKLNDQQAEAAVRLDEVGDFFTLKGYAGTGKSTAITVWAKEKLKKSRWTKICLTAPTNKATRVLKEMANKTRLDVEVCTIHSLLGLKMQWEKDQQVLVPDPKADDKFSEFDYVIVDECGMVGEDPLLKFICQAQKRCGNKVIFMGDPCQLPPVNEKDSRTFDPPDQVELTHIMRQKDGNPIVDLSIYLRELILSPKPRYPSDLFKFVDEKHIFYKPLEQHQAEILDSFESSEDAGLDIRHVAWTNKTVDSWNNKIRDRIYGTDRQDWNEGEQIVTTAPVMNPYEEGILFSTDTLLEIVGEPKEEMDLEVPVWKLPVKSGYQKHTLSVVSSDGMKAFREKKEQLLMEAKKDKSKWRAFYEFMERFSYVKPAFSMTVHRSQGSTFDEVYVSFGNILINPRRKESLQCLYVAITRPKQKLYLV